MPLHRGSRVSESTYVKVLNEYSFVKIDLEVLINLFFTARYTRRVRAQTARLHPDDATAGCLRAEYRAGGLRRNQKISTR